MSKPQVTGYRLSPQQRRYLNPTRMAAPAVSRLVYRCSASVPEQLLKDTIVEALRESPVFHTTFVSIEDGGRLQVPAPGIEPVFEFTGQTGLTGEFGNYELSLSRGPLIKIGLQYDGAHWTCVVDTFPICADQLSLSVLCERIGRRLSGEPSIKERIPYLQYAEWQNGLMTSEEAGIGLEYWKHLWSEAPPPHLLLDRQPEFSNTFEYESHRFHFDASGFPQDISLEDGLAGLWAVVLWKLGGERDFLLGYESNGRDFEELRDSIGLFSRHIPFLCRFSPGQSLEDALRFAGQSLAASREHKDFFGFPQGAPEWLPYQFSFIERSHNEYGDAELVEIVYHAEPFKLALNCVLDDRVLHCAVSWNRVNFSRGDAEFAAAAFRKLAGDAQAGWNIALERASILDATHRRRGLDQSIRRKDRSAGRPASVPESIAALARSQPDAPAVVTPSHRISYGDLLRQSEALAAILRAQNSQGSPHARQRMIALLCRENEEIVVGMLGIRMAGFAFLPIDPSFPSEKIQYILEDSGVSTLVTESTLMLKAHGFAGFVHCLDAVPGQAAPTMSEAGSFEVRPEDLEYVIYTSGTTGNPKGTLIPSKALRNYAAWLGEEFGFSSTDSTVLLSSYAFDLGYTAIWGALAHGAALHIVSDDAIRNPEWLVDYLVEQKITFVKVTPSLFFLIVHAANRERLADSNLRLVMLGGEEIRCDDVAAFLALKPGTTFVNHYGPTETTIGTIAKVIEPQAFPLFRRQPSLGKPIPNNQVLLLDASDELCAPGQLGEICVSGLGLAEGYLHREDLTKEKFRPHPFESGERIYRTGDLGWLRTDGEIVFAGRRDTQVKIKGHRIELEGVQNVIRRHPSITDAVVLAVDMGGVAKELAAYYVLRDAMPAPDGGLNVHELREFLSRDLPDYMIPSLYICIERIPLTPNGKIDRSALPDPRTQALRSSAAFARPDNSMEETVLATWEEVLSRPDIGVNDNYFSLGGDSIKAIQIVSRLARKHLRMQVRDVFDHPTVRAFAARIQIPDAPAPVAAVSVLSWADEARRFVEEHIPDPEEVEDVYPLAPMQAGMFFEYLSDPEVANNVVVRCYHVQGTIQPEIFAETFRRLSKRFSVLRTSFMLRTGYQPFQVVWKKRSVDTGFTDLRDVETGKREQIVRSRIEETRGTPFDLDSDSLMRVELLQTADEGFVVIWRYHHILIDGWCFYQIVEDFFQIYTALFEGRTPELPRVAPYRTYIEWLDGFNFTEAREYWREYLRGYSDPAVIPTQMQYAEGTAYEPRCHSFELDAGITTRLNLLAVSLQVTLNTIFQAAWGILLGRYNDSRDTVFGVAVSGRPEVLPGVESMAGLFINTIPVRVRWEESEPIEKLIRRLQQESLNGQPFHYLPLADVQALTELKNNLVDNILAFENYPVELRTYEAVRQDHSYAIEIKESEGATQIRYGLGVVVMPGEKIRIDIIYDGRVYTPSFVGRIEGHLQTLLEQSLHDPAGSIDSADVLTARERQQLFEVLNGTDAVFPHEKTVVDLFEESVRRFPDKVALAGSWGAIDYRTLNERANLVAKWITGQTGLTGSAGYPCLVGLMFSPGADMIAGILGVLKSGHGYVPLDPDYPHERLKHMIAECGLSLMLTEEIHLPLVKALGEFRTLVVSELDGTCGKPEAKLSPEGPAYVIFTSGSTGRPKGCVISHGNLVRLFRNESDRFDFCDRDTWVLAHSYSFDFSVWEIFGALLNGGRLVLPSRDLLRDIHQFVGLVRDYGVTVLNQTPSAFYRFIDEELRQPEADLNTHLRYVIFGGERLEPYKLRGWAERYDPETVSLVNMYGITETTIHVTYCKLDRDAIGKRSGGSPIGVPLPETKVWICGAGMRLLPAGIPGEIYVGGSGVSQGYLNRPELNHERFVPDPGRPGHRWYKSGDVGRWRDDGTLEFFGRNDDQVQIRGFRVEPGEIENALLDHPAVQSAVVIPVHSADRREESVVLAAYFVPKAEAPPLQPNDLRSFLKGCLPDYMVPSYIVALPALPLTSNNKIDRKALPDPAGAVAERDDRTGLPATALEKRLSEFWSQELGQSVVGMEDSFFDLGGHSLTAVRLVSRIKDELEPDFPVLQLLREPTIRQTAVYIEGARDRTSMVDDTIALLNRGTAGPLFFFPPAVGYAIAFIGLARELGPYAVYGFNFVESKDPIPEYAAHIQRIQPEGPLVLVGFSAGGGVAFQVARLLESRGMTVSSLILLDSRRRLQPEPLTDEQLDRAVSTYINDPQAKQYLVSARLRKQAEQKIRSSAAFIHSLSEHGLIGAPIHLIKSDTTRDDSSRERSWQEVTTGRVHVYEGAGPHVTMLDRAFLGHNAGIFYRILEEVLGHATTV